MSPSRLVKVRAVVRALALLSGLAAVGLALVALAPAPAEAYVYPLAPDLGGRLQMGDVPSTNNIADHNWLLNTPEFDLWGAKVSTARYTKTGSKFTATPANNCARMINDELIQLNYRPGAVPGYLPPAALQGLRQRASGNLGMFALAVVDHALGADTGRTVYWTHSGNAVANADQVNLDMNAYMQAKGGAFVRDTWVFLDPAENIPGRLVKPEAACLLTPFPGVAALHPGVTQDQMNQQIIQATNACKQPTMLGTDHVGCVDEFRSWWTWAGAPWMAGAARLPTQKEWAASRAKRVILFRGRLERASITSNAAFCFSSHPFNEFRYQQQISPVGGSMFTSYARLDSAGAMIDGDARSPAPDMARVGNKALNLCNCAGSRLAAALKLLGVFSAPGAVEPLPADTFNERVAQRKAQNGRVVCFAESRNQPYVGATNQGYEMLGTGQFDKYRTAHSCSTCQVQIQLLYGNSLAPACGDGVAMQTSMTQGRLAWTVLPGAQQARSFISLNEHPTCSEADDSLAPSSPHGRAGEEAVDPLSMVHPRARVAKMKAASRAHAQAKH